MAALLARETAIDQRMVYEKLKTLDGLYGLLTQERDSRWMLILEASIVLLFIIDLVLIFMIKP